MPIENATYISQLDPNNPKGNVRKVLEGDDELRQLKYVLQQTFPNANAAINPTPAEFNILVGATITTAQLNRLSGLAGTANRVVTTDSSGNLTEAAALTGNRALASDANGLLVASAVTDTELGYLSGVTSGVQGQIDNVAAKVAGNLVYNNCFDIDTDNDGVPDHWAFTAYTGGSGAISTSVLIAGSKTFGITSTDTANGGGYLKQAPEAYIPVAPGEQYFAAVRYKTTAAGVRVSFGLYYFDASKAYLGSAATTTVLAPDTNVNQLTVTATIPSGAYYVAMYVVQPSDGTATGTVYFGDVFVRRLGYINSLVVPPTSGTTYVIKPFMYNATGTYYTNQTSYNTNALYDLSNSLGCVALVSGTVTVYFQHASDSTVTVYARIVKNGSQLIEYSKTGFSYTTRTYDVSVAPGDVILIQQRSSSSGTYAFWRYVGIRSGNAAFLAVI